MNREDNRQAKRRRQGSVILSGERRDYAVESNALGAEVAGVVSSQQDSTYSTDSALAAAHQTEMAHPLTGEETSQFLAQQNDESKESSNAKPACSNNDGSSSSVGENSFESLVDLLIGREVEEQSANVRAQNQSSESAPRVPAIYPGEQQTEQHHRHRLSTMSANLLEQTSRDPGIASPMWPTFLHPPSHPATTALGGAAQISRSDTSSLPTSGADSDATIRTDMTSVVASFTRENHIAMVLTLTSHPFRVAFSTQAFNTLVGRDVVGEPFHDVFRQPIRSLVMMPNLGLASLGDGRPISVQQASPPLGLGNFLIDGRIARQAHVTPVFSDDRTTNHGLLYYKAAIVS